jgi:hypothetical protein
MSGSTVTSITSEELLLSGRPKSLRTFSAAMKPEASLTKRWSTSNIALPAIGSWPTVLSSVSAISVTSQMLREISAMVVASC